MIESDPTTLVRLLSVVLLLRV